MEVYKYETIGYKNSPMNLSVIKILRYGISPIFEVLQYQSSPILVTEIHR